MITLYNIDAGTFMELLDKVRDDVFLVTDEGDRINMKSKLCQLYGIRLLLNAIDNGKITASLECKDPADKMLFIDYLVTNKIPA